MDAEQERHNEVINHLRGIVVAQTLTIQAIITASYGKVNKRHATLIEKTLDEQMKKLKVLEE